MSLIITRGFGLSGGGSTIAAPLEGSLVQYGLEGKVENTIDITGVLLYKTISGEVKIEDVDGNIGPKNITGVIE